MQRDKQKLYILIGGATLGFIMVLSWLLGAFSSNDTEQTPIRATNNIIEQPALLPQICQNTITLMNCIITSDQLSGEKAFMSQSYQQLLSEWNVVTDLTVLEQSCTTQYQYLTNITEQPYQSLIQSCL